MKEIELELNINEILDYMRDKLDNIKPKWFNTIKISESGITDFNLLLLFYEQKYEIKEFLLFLSIIGKAKKDNVIDLKREGIRDKRGHLNKKRCIDDILSKLNKYNNLKKSINIAYNYKLRNIIGHNEYKVNSDVIESIDGKLSISKEDFLTSLYHLQGIHNSIKWLLEYYELKSKETELTDNGIISIGFDYSNFECKLNIFQLWCFYDIKIEWLDQIKFLKENNKLKTILSKNAETQGGLNKKLSKCLEKATDFGFVNIELFSIIPNLGLEARNIVLNGYNYQLIDNKKINKVNIKVSNV